MPKKSNRRKEIQAAKRKDAADELARKNKKWPGTRKTVVIAHRHSGHMGANLAVIAAVMAAVTRIGNGDTTND
jgi:uncharacterized membrane protein YdbT with pleckstrin-like domain